MNKIIVDAELLARLRDLKEPLELCDKDGKVLANVVPKFDLSDYEPWIPPMDEEELRRRAESNDWITTQELLDGLEEA